MLANFGNSCFTCDVSALEADALECIQDQVQQTPMPFPVKVTYMLFCNCAQLVTATVHTAFKTDLELLNTSAGVISAQHASQQSSGVLIYVCLSVCTHVCVCVQACVSASAELKLCLKPSY